MKVELDLSAEQLNALDSEMTNLLKNLTEEQKISILQTYFLYEFRNIRYAEKSEYGYYRKDDLTDFGKAVINGLQNKITDSISEKILEDENLKKEITDIQEKVLKELPNTINKAITKYIVDNLFTDKKEITMIAEGITYNAFAQRANNYYN